MLGLRLRALPDAFPTGVGMNRSERAFATPSASVPHGRGDEPLLGEFAGGA